MRVQFIKFLINIGIFSGIIGTAGWVLFAFVLSKYYLPVFPYVFVFFMIVTSAIYYAMLRILRLKPARFISYFMALTTVKLIVFLIFMIIYLLADKEHGAPFLIVFLILYLLFTVFEVIAVLNQSKKATDDIGRPSSIPSARE